MGLRCQQPLEAQGIIFTIREPPTVGATVAAPTAAAQDVQAVPDALEAKNAKTIIIMIRHMDESLQSEYLNEEDPVNYGLHSKSVLAMSVNPCFLT